MTTVNGVRLSPLLWTMLDWIGRGDGTCDARVYSQAIERLERAGLVVVGEATLRLTPLGERARASRGPS